MIKWLLHIVAMAIQLQPSPALNWLRSPRLGTWLHHSETGSESSPPWLGKANMTSARPPLQRWKWAKTGQKLVTGANWCHFQLGKNLPFYGLVKRQQFHSASERKLHLFSDVQLPPLKKPGCVFDDLLNPIHGMCLGSRSPVGRARYKDWNWQSTSCHSNSYMAMDQYLWKYHV